MDGVSLSLVRAVCVVPPLLAAAVGDGYKIVVNGFG